jgi:hypothetical protein
MNTPNSQKSVRPILGRGPNEVNRGIKTVAQLAFAVFIGWSFAYPQN